MTNQKPRVLKSCQNCAYRTGEFNEFGKCLLTGHYCSTQRAYPTRSCNRRFSGWVPREGVSSNAEAPPMHFLDYAWRGLLLGLILGYLWSKFGAAS